MLLPQRLLMQKQQKRETRKKHTFQETVLLLTVIKKTETILLVLDKKGTSVIDTLQKADIDPISIRVNNVPVIYPSGAALLVVEKDKLTELKNKIVGIQVQIKEITNDKPFEFRIYNLPQNTSLDYIKNVTLQRTG